MEQTLDGLSSRTHAGQAQLRAKMGSSSCPRPAGWFWNLPSQAEAVMGFTVEIPAKMAVGQASQSLRDPQQVPSFKDLLKRAGCNSKSRKQRLQSQQSLWEEGYTTLPCPTSITHMQGARAPTGAVPMLWPRMPINALGRLAVEAMAGEAHRLPTFSHPTLLTRCTLGPYVVP